MRRIVAQVHKELTQIVRDYRTLTLALLLPLFLLMLLGAAISLTVDDLPIVVQDLDQTPASQDYIDAFRASVTFHVVSWPVDRRPRRRRLHVESGSRRSPHPAEFRARHRAGSEHAGANSGGWFGLEYRAVDFGGRDADYAGLQRAHGESGASATRADL